MKAPNAVAVFISLKRSLTDLFLALIPIDGLWSLAKGQKCFYENEGDG